MRPNCYKACGTVLLAAALLPSLQPQQASPERDENRVTLDVTRVSLLASVTDKKGRFVSTLAKDDFVITEDQRPQSIVQFRSEADLPLRMAVLIDASNSVRDRFRFIQDAAIAFLENTLIRGRDKAILVSFDTVVESLGDFTDDPAALAGYIRELRPGRGTAMYDAIDFVCRKKFQEEAAKVDCRRVIVILSDGDDTQSRSTRSMALEAAHKSDAVIYPISTAMGVQLGSTGTRVLLNVAEETGGRALFPLVVKDLTNSFKELSTELRSQYSIVYRPEGLSKDGRFRPIQIGIKGRKDLHVRTRKGYFAPMR